ncbi:uncharacterized protein L201_005761 [Kwoniella dendrophila CBS 6074]|uniref:Arp2/3 complex 34 kDa subunit n=1 Tax=Kwoniella dendrophila CBS 6074 TaxID=1295534 RepID=A0AAX4K071_9TREE
MILLESHSVIINDVLTDRFEKASRADIQFVDYDNVRFHLSTPETKSKILLSMGIQCWPDLLKYGAREYLQNEYQQYLLPQEQTEPEYDVSLMIDLEQLPESVEDRNSLISKLSHLKSVAMSSPFLSAFQEQSNLQAGYKDAGGAQQKDFTSEQSAETKGELKIIRYREEEAIYIQASNDRVTVVFSTVFKEETDKVFGRVFLQEFVDARKLNALQNAPQVRYSNREPPLEIRHLPGLHNGEDWGYVTFVLFPRHFSNPTQAQSTINRIQLFRDYLHYHIKCSKAYMHSRMRYRVAEFLKILNRAKPEVATAEKKTASGRTFRTR